MAATSTKARKYVAVLSPTVCVIHNWTDAAEIGRRVVSVQSNGMLATRCFTTQKDALCWLTNPVHTEAMAAAAALARRSETVGNDHGGRIAVVTRFSSRFLGVDAASVASALAMVRDPDFGACVFRRFASEMPAWQWLIHDAGRCLLDILRWPNEDDVPRVPRIGPIPSAPQPGLPPDTAATSSCAGTAADGHSAGSAFVDMELVSSSCASWSGGSRSGAVVQDPIGMSLLGKRPAATAATGARVTAPLGSTEGRVGGYSSSSPERRLATEPPIVELDLTGGRPIKRRRSTAAEFDPVRPRTPPAARASRETHWSASDACDLLETIQRVVPPGADDGRFPPSAGRADSGLQRPYDIPPASFVERDGQDALQARQGRTPLRGGSRNESQAGPSGRRWKRAGSDGGALSPNGVGPIGHLAGAGRWDEVCEQLFARVNSAFNSGGPGAGKSTLLRRLRVFLQQRYPAEGEVVVLAPTGTAAKTAGGMTSHFFFGFVRD